MKPYYEQSGITIYHCDCREVLPVLDRFDLVLTDPPYGKSIAKTAQIGATGGKQSMNVYVPSTWDDGRPSLETLQLVMEAAPVSIIWGGNYFADLLPAVDSWLVWDKKLRNDWKDTYADVEMAWSNIGGPARCFRHLWMGACRASETSLGQGKQHPTQKPLALMDWCLGFAPLAKTVCDPFMGSGTTLVAAKRLGKIATGIELDERYCEIAAKRLAQEALPMEFSA